MFDVSRRPESCSPAVFSLQLRHLWAHVQNVLLERGAPLCLNAFRQTVRSTLEHRARTHACTHAGEEPEEMRRTPACQKQCLTADVCEAKEKWCCCLYLECCFGSYSDAAECSTRTKPCVYNKGQNGICCSHLRLYILFSKVFCVLVLFLNLWIDY